MAKVASLFSAPKVPKPPAPAPVAPIDTAAGQDAMAQAQLEARQQARRRAGLQGLLYSGSAGVGSTSTPRTTSGGLMGS